MGNKQQIVFTDSGIFKELLETDYSKGRAKSWQNSRKPANIRATIHLEVLRSTRGIMGRSTRCMRNMQDMDKK